MSGFDPRRRTIARSSASGRIEGRVYATGHYRNGVLLAPITARGVADIIEGKAAGRSLDACTPRRFGEY